MNRSSTLPFSQRARRWDTRLPTRCSGAPARASKASARSRRSRNSFRFWVRTDTVSAKVTSGETFFPPDSAIARSKCRRAFSADPPIASGRPPSKAMKYSWIAPPPYPPLSARARRRLGGVRRQRIGETVPSHREPAHSVILRPEQEPAGALHPRPANQGILRLLGVLANERGGILGEPPAERREQALVVRLRIQERLHRLEGEGDRFSNKFRIVVPGEGVAAGGDGVGDPGNHVRPGGTGEEETPPPDRGGIPRKEEPSLPHGAVPNAQELAHFLSEVLSAERLLEEGAEPRGDDLPDSSALVVPADQDGGKPRGVPPPRTPCSPGEGPCTSSHPPPWRRPGSRRRDCRRSRGSRPAPSPGRRFLS